MSLYRNIILFSGSILTALMLMQYPSLLPPGLVSLIWSSPGVHHPGWLHRIKVDLGPQLSSDASVLSRQDGQAFREATIRWQEHAPPTFAASVRVRTEADVQSTIRFANAHNVSFLATSGKHGDNLSLSKLRDGIQIDMRDMADVVVDPSEDFAIIGGGVLQQKLIENLRVAGKRTTTGICDCVGIGGLALGGGHGLLQGQFGLLADQIISARIVLATGEAVTTSRTENSDLFWALRGAGHNFGVVTQFRLQVYPLAGHENWTVQMLVYPGSRLEDVYTTANKLALTQPAEAVHMSMFIIDPSVDSVQPIITYLIFFDGSSTELLEHTGTLLSDLGPIATSIQSVPYASLPAFILSSQDDPGCDKAVGVFRRFPIDFHTPYNVTAMRKMYDHMRNTLQAVPEFGRSWIAIEAYSTQAVETIPDADTAFAFRKDNLLIAPFVYYMPDPALDLKALDAKAVEFGENLRTILQEGQGKPLSELHAYVNYANGLEAGGMKNWYGQDEKRLQKLRGLKQIWDPEERFSFYAPIELR